MCLLTALFGSVINVLLCTIAQNRVLTFAFSKPNLLVQRTSLCCVFRFSSQIVELFAARLHHNTIVHTAPPRIGLHYSPTSLTNMISQNSGSQIESFPLPPVVGRKQSCQLSNCFRAISACASGSLVSVALAIVIGGIQLPKRGSSGSYRIGTSAKAGDSADDRR
jgi:hypothetical protein